MPGLVQMLEGLRDEDDDFAEAFAEGYSLGDLGASEPPALLVAMLQSVVQAPEIRQYLRALGVYFARRAVSVVKDLLINNPRPVPPNAWVEGLLMPIVGEVMEGAGAELRRQARPWAIGLAALTGVAGLGLGALLGSRRRKLYERGRRDATAAGR